MFNIYKYHPQLRQYYLKINNSLQRIRFETDYQLEERIDSFDISENIIISYEYRVVLIIQIHTCDFQQIENITSGIEAHKLYTLTSKLATEIQMNGSKENLIAMYIENSNLILFFDSNRYIFSLRQLLQYSNCNFHEKHMQFKNRLTINPKRGYIAIYNHQKHITILFQTNGQYDNKNLRTTFQVILIEDNNNEKCVRKPITIPFPRNMLRLDDQDSIFPYICKVIQQSSEEEIQMKIVTQIRAHLVIQLFKLDQNLAAFFFSQEILANESQEQHYLGIQSDNYNIYDQDYLII